MPQAVRDGIVVVLVISGPLVMAAAFIGLVIGILQAATQVQEQTIGSALKIIGVFAIIIFAGFWMYQYLNQYTLRTFTTAFTFVPRQAQKAVPVNAFKNEEEFNQTFQEKIHAEELKLPPRVEPPEKIESELPEAGTPPGVPYVGTPEIPKPPSVSKIIPVKIPEIPQQQIIKPKIPLSDFQEPKTLSSTKNQTPTVSPQQAPKPPVQDTKTNNEANIDTQQINVVPGKPTTNKAELESDIGLKQEKEVFTEKPKDEPKIETNEVTPGSADTEELPSWLN